MLFALPGVVGTGRRALGRLRSAFRCSDRVLPAVTGVVPHVAVFPIAQPTVSSQTFAAFPA